MTDVKLLISALTTERNAIDRAISGLQQMSEIRASKTTPKPERVQRAPSKQKHRMKLSADVKAQIVARMASASHRSRMAETLAKEFGAPYHTIQSGWRRWQTATDNGAAQSPVEAIANVQ